METIAGITTLFALGLWIPSFVGIIYIVKHFNSDKFRMHYSYKLLLFNSLIYSIYLVLSLFYPAVQVGFIILSFMMIPSYIMLVFRKINSSIQSSTSEKVSKDVAKQTSGKKRLAARLKREKIRLIAKSKWK